MDNMMKMIGNIQEEYKNYLMMVLVFLVLLAVIYYFTYLTSLRQKGCSHMDKLYGSLNGKLRSITPNDASCKGRLFDYFIKTAYNACSGGDYRNDYVDLCNLRACLREGVRCLDFEIYSSNGVPIVATSTSKQYFFKETLNFITFSSVMKTIQDYAFSSGTAPNPEDPIIVHLRIRTNKQQAYDKMADTFKNMNEIMLGKEYSFDNLGKNLGQAKLLDLRGKIVLIVDRSNDSFMQNQAFLEYVNMTSNSMNMRLFNYSDIKNNLDNSELLDYNKHAMTIVLPDNGVSPANPSAFACRQMGCQMVAMRFQRSDSNLQEDIAFFDDCTFAFCMKPKVMQSDQLSDSFKPVPQEKKYSYQTRKTTVGNF